LEVISLNTIVKNLYEGLFLVDSGEAAADWDGINKAIGKVLARGDAEVVSIRKWDERRLAYDINGKSRGTYILTYFRGDPSKIAAIERAVQLSEQIMRVLIIRTDRMRKENMEKDTPAMVVERTEAAAEAAAAAKAAAAEAKTSAKIKSVKAKAAQERDGAAQDEIKAEEDKGQKTEKSDI
jgi:small subunit ribosomal protein S6